MIGIVVDALGVCGLADEEGQSLHVGGAIGNGAVGANAGVGECYLEYGSAWTCVQIQ